MMTTEDMRVCCMCGGRFSLEDIDPEYNLGPSGPPRPDGVCTSVGLCVRCGDQRRYDLSREAKALADAREAANRKPPDDFESAF